MEAIFKLERETKNTGRFEEETEFDTPVVGMLYVQKWVLKELGDPQRIKVTIEAVEEE